MTALNPYLKFDGNCREAMNFYQDILGWQLTILTVDESSVGDQMPAAKDSVMHSFLTSGDKTIMGSDLHWGEPHSNGNGLQICINCESETEINHLFSSLAAGGQIAQPLVDLPWGSTLGSVIDKYGKYWILNYDKEQAY